MERVKNLIKIIEKYQILKVLICSLILGICVVTIVRADDLSIQLTKEIVFKNGYGQIEAKPILKNVNKDIKVMGEYNVETKNGNVEMKIDRVLYDGKIYQLSEPFISKRRLKNYLTAKLDKDAKLKLSDGNHDEILAILNGEATPAKDTTKTANTTTNNTSDVNSGSSNSYSGYGSGRSSSSGSSYTPYILSSSDTSSTTSTTSSTSSSSTKCNDPQVNGDEVIVYTDDNGTCTKHTLGTDQLYYKYNTTSCANKIDYDNNVVSIGQEQYVYIDDAEYKVTSCAYEREVPLEISYDNCEAIPNFQTKIAKIQAQYYYSFNNTKTNVGECFSTGETTTIYDDDYNSCDYRLDFVNGVAIKQTQWYYYWNNVKTTLGECVDASDKDSFTYDLYEDAVECGCDTYDINNTTATICQSKLVFNGLDGSKTDATDCRVIFDYGLPIMEEFSGYAYKDDSKQTIRKINQYFYSKYGQKIYITKDVETNVSYPYKYESCGWNNNDDELYSTIKTRIYFEDTDENVTVEVLSCDDEANLNITVMPYVQISTTENVTETLSEKTLVLDSTTNRYYIYGTDTYIENTPNASRNICYYTANSTTLYSGSCPLNCYYSTYNPNRTCSTSVPSSLSSEIQASLSITITDSYISDTITYHSTVTSIKDGYANNQVIELVETYIKYLRPDGSYYTSTTPVSTLYYAR